MVYDLIIIGGGPAGAAAAVYAARKRLKTILITKDIGGQSVNSATIENFIGHTLLSGLEFSHVLEKQLRAQEGLELRLGVYVQEITSHDDGYIITTTKGESFQAKYVLYTLGSSYRKLGVPGEHEYEGKGVFYCSICDAPLMKGKDVLVVGGGNSGLEAVLDVIPYARTVTLIDRSDVLRGDAVLQEKVTTSPLVTVRLGYTVQQFEGTQFLEKVTLQNIHTHTTEILSISGAFISIGYAPNTELLAHLVARDDSGRIIVDRKTMQTSRPGIWAAGDCTDGLYHQINTAIGDGVTAALNIYDVFQGDRAHS